MRQCRISPYNGASTVLNLFEDLLPTSPPACLQCESVPGPTIQGGALEHFKYWQIHRFSPNCSLVYISGRSESTCHLFALTTQAGSVAQPRTALLFLLAVSLLLEGLELLLGECLAAALCPQAAAIVAIRSSVYVEESVHLPLAFVRVIVHLWANVGLLKLASEAIEVCLSQIVLALRVGKTSRGSGSLLIFLVFIRFTSVVCVWIVATVDSGVVTTPLAFGW